MLGFKEGQRVNTKRGEGKVVDFDTQCEWCIGVVLDADASKTVWWCRRESLDKLD